MLSIAAMTFLMEPFREVTNGFDFIDMQQPVTEDSIIEQLPSYTDESRQLYLVFMVTFWKETPVCIPLDEEHTIMYAYTSEMHKNSGTARLPPQMYIIVAVFGWLGASGLGVSIVLWIPIFNFVFFTFEYEK